MTDSNPTIQTTGRDVENPILFEIAWEVANKGKLCIFS
jgi:hypothetical protein